MIVEELRPQVELSELTTGLYRDFPEESPVSSDRQEHDIDEPGEGSGGITTLLARYFTGEDSGSSKGVIYH